MEIFISWSGQTSKQIASYLKDWLPSIFQDVEIFVSDHDIEAGSSWLGRLNSELKVSKFGILCLTSDNMTAPWLLFEAGALSKALEETRVVPYLFKIKKTDVTAPLSQFQSAYSDKNDTYKLLQSINKQLGKPLSQELLAKIFNKWWGELEENLNGIKVASLQVVEKRQVQDIVEEILQLVRNQSRKVETRRRLSEITNVISIVKFPFEWDDRKFILRTKKMKGPKGVEFHVELPADLTSDQADTLLRIERSISRPYTYSFEGDPRHEKIYQKITDALRDYYLLDFGERT